MPSPHRILVGVDFGTTYSGVAWIHTANPEEVNVIMSWPHGRGIASEKVPSLICYNNEFQLQGYNYKWGFEAQSLTNKIEWAKLLLEPSLGRRIPELRPVIDKIRDRLPPNKEAVDVVASYLSALERYVRLSLKGRYGDGMMESIQTEYILTVPAVWSDAAKALTLEAAERAGFGSKSSLQLISEPEAAAVYSIPSIKPNHLKIGDTFVIADCGGGTVDLISYQIIKLTPKLEVKEYAVGGGLCGSSFIDRAFEKFVSAKAGAQLEKMKPMGRLKMMQSFDYLKIQFSEDDDENSYCCSVPGMQDDENAGIEDGLLYLRKEDMKSIFDPVVNDVVKLVQDQVKKVENKRSGVVSAILLVGGFGSSEYLREQLEKRIKSTRTGGDVPILRPAHPWSAVVRGAVLSGLQGTLVPTSRLARSHYGVSFYDRFIEGVHPEKDKFWDNLEEIWLCNDRARWFIKKGTEVKDNEQIRREFYRTFSSDEINVTLCDELIICDEDDAPKSTNDSRILSVCTLRYNLKEIPSRNFVTKRNSKGKEYKILNYSLIMKLDQSATLVYSMEVDGVEYANVKTKFSNIKKSS